MQLTTIQHSIAGNAPFQFPTLEARPAEHPCILPATLKPHCQRQPPLVDGWQHMSNDLARELYKKFRMRGRPSKPAIRKQMQEWMARETANWALAEQPMHIEAYIGIVELRNGRMTFKLTQDCVAEVMLRHACFCESRDHGDLEHRVNCYTYCTGLDIVLNGLRKTGTSALPSSLRGRVTEEVQCWLRPCS